MTVQNANMTKRLLYLVLLPFVLAGCQPRKYYSDPDDYLPGISTSSAVCLPDGTVAVKGTVVSPGPGDLYGLGFCLDTLPNPTMEKAQLQAGELSGPEFTGYYKELRSLKRYYIRSFAVNENGYVYGNEVTIDNPTIDTNRLPCLPPANKVIYDYGSSQDVVNASASAIESGITNPTFNIRDGMNGFRVELYRYPHTGLYKTVEQSPREEGDVLILQSGQPILRGKTVYFIELAPGQFKVIMCNGENAFNNMKVSFNVLSK